MPQSFADFHAPANVDVLGVYEWQSTNQHDRIVITDVSFNYFDDEVWNSIQYADILDMDTMSQEKYKANKLRFNFKNGEARVVSIAGGGERLRDVYTFQSFFGWAVNHVARKSMQAGAS